MSHVTGTTEVSEVAEKDDKSNDAAGFSSIEENADDLHTRPLPLSSLNSPMQIVSASHEQNCFESQIQPVAVDTNVGFSKSRTIALGMNSSRPAAPRPTLPRPNPECCDHECYPEDDAPDEKCCWRCCGRTP